MKNALAIGRREEAGRSGFAAFNKAAFGRSPCGPFRNEEYRNFPGGNIPREWRGGVHRASSINFEAYSDKARNGEDSGEKNGQSQRFSRK